jgi:hypothetical protein
MWLLELIGISLVAGTILGVSWRLLEDAWEKHTRNELEKARTSSTNKSE